MSDTRLTPPDPAPPASIGRFTVLHKLGEGGMGVVYAARDDRLGRDVAVKVMRQAEADRGATERMLREARAAAAFTHPSFCQIFEIGEETGRPFLVMELLTGEPLSTRLAAGPLPTREAVAITLDLLTALDVLHAQGLVHRDLKPSNVFLTAHGIKLLDFGLARPVAMGDETVAGLTLPGMLVGTPHYMSPEQARGAIVDVRTDLFAAGVVLFEMIAGYRPFTGPSVIEVLHAVIEEHPPALTGSPGIVGVDRVIHKALAKQASQRYATAREMASDLRGVAPLIESGEVAHAVRVTRLAVLPFRLLRPDTEIDYLSYGLADAITSALAGFQSLVVRSSLASSRFGADHALDIHRVANDLDVDLLLTGTLLRAGDRLRVGVELVEAATGKATWSQVTQMAIGDLFELQDALTERVMSALPLTSADRAQAVPRDIPADDQAYEWYLRANTYAAESSTWRMAHDLYEQSLERDPSFAPAWARLGRMRRVLGKYSSQEEPAVAFAQAEAALRRALELNPTLSDAHLYLAQLETDLGRAEQSIGRLLALARGGRAEPAILAGLVHACRYGGLLTASVAAHDLATRLDPSIKTGVVYSYMAQAQYERALQVSANSVDSIDAVILDAMGRSDAARAAAVREEERFSAHSHARLYYTAMRALLEGRVDDCRAAALSLAARRVSDGEAVYFLARFFARLGDVDQALHLFAHAVSLGYSCVPFFDSDPWMTDLRSHPRFRDLMGAARLSHEAARVRFERDGGNAVLGIGQPV